MLELSQTLYKEMYIYEIYRYVMQPENQHILNL